jgi:autotransporter adhesin
MTYRFSLLAAAIALYTTFSPVAHAGGECIFHRIEDGAGYGTGNSAPGTGAIVCGVSNTVDAGSGATAMAFGVSNEVYTGFSSASGWSNYIGGYIDYYGLDIRGQENTASGNRNSVYGGNDSAFGVQNRVIGFQSSASGFFNVLQAANESTAVGSRNRVIGVEEDGTVDGDEAAIERASAFGYGNLASDNGATAIGNGNEATAENGNAFGYANEASGARASAFGTSNIAGAGDANAFGQDNEAMGRQSSAFGYNNSTLGAYDVAFGSGNTTTLDNSFGFAGNNVAVGIDNIADGGSILDFGTRPSTVAIGVANSATRTNAVALGVQNTASEIGGVAIGYRSSATGQFSVAIGTAQDTNHDGVIGAGEGYGAAAIAVNATAVGAGAYASAADSTAIGAGAVADREGVVSIGNADVQRQLVNLAAGTQDTDAVNLSQLYPVATALGGGASYAGGVFTAPTYVIQSSNYNDVGSAFAAVDGALDDINDRIVAVGGIQGEQGESAYEVAVSNGFAGTEDEWLTSLQGDPGPSGPTGPEGPAGGGPRSVVYDSDDQASLTLGGANGTRISNVANGVAATDAANVGQMQAGDADTLQAANEYTDNTATETLTSANAYTDQRFAELTGLSDSFDTFRGEVDRRFQQQDRRIDKQGSMSSAMLNMAMNASGSQSPRGRVAAGVGFQGGERALSVGYAKRIGERVSFSLGGAFSGSEKSAGMGFGVDL